MPRAKRIEPPPPPAVVHPNTVYLAATFKATFGLRGTSLPREVRSGRLRVSKRCGRYYILGAWALDWIRAGEVKRAAPVAGPTAEGQAR